MALALALAGPALAGGIAVSDGWVRESIPGQDRSVAYLRIVNNGREDCPLTGVTTGAAGRVEVHEHRHHEGRMQMRPVDSLVLPAGSAVEFKPGGLHLMVLDLHGPLRKGDVVTFHFSAGICGDTEAQFPVKGR